MPPAIIKRKSQSLSSSTLTLFPAVVTPPYAVPACVTHSSAKEAYRELLSNVHSQPFGAFSASHTLTLSPRKANARPLLGLKPTLM